MPPHRPHARSRSLRPARSLQIGFSVHSSAVYSVSVDDDNKVVVDMSLTSPGCPAGPQILGDV